MLRAAVISLHQLRSKLSALFTQPLKVFMSNDERLALEIAFGLCPVAPRVIEWGSGGSTVHFSQLLPSGSKWLAVEHQAPWAARVQTELQRLGVSQAAVHCFPPDGAYKEGIDDGDEQTFRSYVGFASAAGSLFDAAVVDGRARVACVREAWKVLSPDGFVALHDAQREDYAAARPSDAFQVKVRDPRKQLDGADIELHVFFKRGSTAEAFAAQLRERLSPSVAVSLQAVPRA